VDETSKNNQIGDVPEKCKEKVTEKRIMKKKKEVPEKEKNVEAKTNSDKIEANVANTLLDTTHNNLDREKTSGAFSTFACFVDLSKFK
jgi:hypothetical protein